MISDEVLTLRGALSRAAGASPSTPSRRPAATRAGPALEAWPLLSNYRVLDLSDERGHLAGRMLADLGADVIKIEPPGGDLERGREPFSSAQARERGMSLAWMANNPGKRSLVLDLAPASPDRAVFRALLATSDVVLDAGPGGRLAGLGFDYATMCDELPQSHPGLILALISPFGQMGPYSGLDAHDLVCVAMGGNASVTGDPDRPPLASSLPTAYMHGGAEAVVAILVSLLARPALGTGQEIDVSLQECQLASLITGAGQYPLSPGPRPRTGPRTGITREIWRCRDGWVSYGLRGGPARIPGLVATVEYMDEWGMAPDWLKAMDWQTYSPQTLEAEQLARLEETFAAFFSERSMRELYEESLRRRILLAPCNDAREILGQPQLRARDFFVPVEYPGLGLVVEQPGFFARSSAGGLGLRGPAPEIDAHGDSIRRELETQPRQAGDPEPRREAFPR